MYIWIGCKLPEDFETEIRSYCLERNRSLGLDTTAFLLPQHISLKISFQTDQTEEVLEDLAQFLSAQSTLTVRIVGVEQKGNILWMPIAENDSLRWLHQQLDARLEQRFQVPQHEFDKCFLFHSTLFIDPDGEKLAQMEKILAEYPVERELLVDTFLIGLSETGKPGTYRVVRQFGL